MAAWLGVAVLVLGLTHWRNVGLSVVVLESKKNSKDLEGFDGFCIKLSKLSPTWRIWGN